MPFSFLPHRLISRRPSAGTIIVALALGWMAFISYMHYMLNVHKGFAAGSPQVVKMGYMPVVANIAAPLLDAVTKENTSLRLESVMFASFADMAEALRNDHIQVAFIIAPLSIVLRQQGENIRVVFIGSRHESTLVGRAKISYTHFSDLAGKTIAVPTRFSGHNLEILRLAEQHGIRNRIRIVEMNPPDMPAALSRGNIDAYFVGEPFAAQTIISNDAKVLQYVEETWPGFVCNLMIMQNAFISSHPEKAAAIVQASVRAGLWAGENPHEAAEILSRYWSQSPSFIEYVLTAPAGRIRYDQYLPLIDELHEIAALMKRFDMTSTTDIEGLVFDTFAKMADTYGINDFASIWMDQRGDALPRTTEMPGEVTTAYE